MQTVSRKFGQLMNKGPGENAKVSVLLNDYDDVDKVLAKVNASSTTKLAEPLNIACDTPFANILRARPSSSKIPSASETPG